VQAHIVRPDPSAEFYTPERCFILESWNTPEDQGLSIARARVQPGVTTALHALRATIERYLIMSGCGIVEIDSLPPTPVTSGDIVVIPSGAAQRVTNNGDTDLVFYAICTPRFQGHAYQALEPR
jgi:mannose-6-phosphate isomerase-like protein (cupin superfamily)